MPAGPGGIARANLDGSGVDQNFISGIDADQLAVDANHIYWTGNLCEPGCQDIASGIGRANLDGTGLEAGFIPGLPRGITGLNALAIDASHIYWTGQAHDFIPGSTLGRANLDGSGVEPTFIGGTTGLHSGFWTGVTIDAAHIYWADYEYFDNAIVRANIDGSGRKSFIKVGGDEHFLPGALAVDALTDPRPEGNARAARTQRQTGRRIVVKVKVQAKEELTAKATGKIKVNPTYKLRPMKVDLTRGETKRLKLKPKHRAWKIAKALKQGQNAKAKLTVELTDAAENRETEKLLVRLKG